MTEFLSMVLTECYVDRQPELFSVLYDELDQERPRQLAMLFSPTGSQPPSAGPSLNYGSAAPGSHGVMAPPPVFTKPASNKSNNLARKFMSRPKSFDTSLTRGVSHLRRLVNEFWKKWSQSYYQSLVKYHRWRLRERNCEPGDVVLVLDREGPKGKFTLGLIDSVKTDSDNAVRKVTVKS